MSSVVGKTIGDLPEAIDLTDDDIMEIQNNLGESKKVPAKKLKDYIGLPDEASEAQIDSLF